MVGDAAVLGHYGGGGVCDRFLRQRALVLIVGILRPVICSPLRCLVRVQRLVLRNATSAPAASSHVFVPSSLFACTISLAPFCGCDWLRFVPVWSAAGVGVSRDPPGDVRDHAVAQEVAAPAPVPQRLMNHLGTVVQAVCVKGRRVAEARSNPRSLMPAVQVDLP